MSERTFRPLPIRLLSAATLGLVVLVAALAAEAVPSTPGRAGVLFAAFGIGIVGLARAWQISVSVRTDGLQIDNLIRRRFVRWESIDWIGPGSLPLLTIQEYTVLVVKLKRRRIPVPIQATGPVGRNWLNRAALDAIREEAERHDVHVLV